MIERMRRIAAITVKCKLLIVINANGCPSLRRKHTLQPCIESWDDQQVAGSLLRNATPASQIECTNIEVVCNTRIAIDNMPTRCMHWVSE